MAESRLDELSARGQSVWIDYLSRDLLETGELKRMMEEDAVVGVTSNPTIFQKAISQGNAYDEQLKELLSRESDPKEIFLHLAVRDVENALDLLLPVHERNAQDGYVSIEVDPTLAYDTEATYKEAIRLHEWIRRPNLYVKIPGTEPGLKAIEDCIAGGHSINVTLLFSLQMHKKAMEAYVCGLERLVEGGGDASKVRSVASFFVSRVDTETDKRLHEEPRVPRRPLRRGPDRPAHGEHDAGGDDPGLPGSRRGARRHRRRRSRRGPRATARTAAGGRRRLRRRRGDAREGRRAEVLRLVRRAARRREGQARDRRRLSS